MKSTALDLTGSEKNKLRADILGSAGHPVILLHGGGQTRHSWEKTARQIAQSGMRAITVDLRGHGGSDWVPSGDYTFRAFGTDATTMFRHVAEMCGEAPSVIGASLGGLSALIAETSSGPLIRSLVLVDVTPRMDPEGVSKVQGFMGQRLDSGFVSLDEAADAIAAYLPHRERPGSLGGLRKNLRLHQDGRYRWHWDPVFINGDRNIGAGSEEIMEEVTARLPFLKVPTLLVRGMQSELVHEEHAREFVTLAPCARYVDIGGAGHMIAGDKNDIFCDSVMDFLKEEAFA